MAAQIPHVSARGCSAQWNQRNLILRLIKATIWFAALASVTLPVWSQQNTADLTERPLEDLMNMQVTSVSKEKQQLSRAASAIFVITAGDIARSQATNIPDLLRMVPGADVAQINSNTWAVSIRGFNQRFSNKLLVLVDGRPLYTPTFGGVFWDVLDVPLEDIQRIEVIRGPGGSIWGANAVNGVINIITKKSSETKGGMVTGGGGNVNQGFGTIQYGGGLGKSTDYRIYTKYLNQDHMPGVTNQSGADGWHLLNGGFRLDTTLSSKNTLSLQGDLYDGREGVPTSFAFPPNQVISPQVDLSGGFLQAIWNHVYSDRSDTSLQLSYDAYKRDDVLGEGRKTVNADFQHHFAWGDRQNIVWGLDYQYSTSRSIAGLTVSLNPSQLDTQLFSSFAQDEIALVSDRLYVTVGTKLEHDYYTGFAVMPTARVTFAASNHQMFWAGVSRAARTPSATDESIRVNFVETPGPSGIPLLISLFGNPHSQNEGVIAYEAGYRASLLDRLSLDFAAYYNSYKHLQTIEPGIPFFETSPPPPNLVLPTIYGNLMHGETHGFEISANWRAMARWTLSPSYSFEQIHMHLDPNSQDTTSVDGAEGSSPMHSAQLRSHVDLLNRVSWDTNVYFVDRLTDFSIPSYTRLDTGITWNWAEHSSVAFVGQNLLKDRHLEFEDTTRSAQSSLIKRSAYAKFTWQF